VTASNDTGVELPGSHQELIDTVNATQAAVPDGTLDELILGRAARHRDQPAAVSAQGGVSYGGLRDSASDVARRLADLGVAAGGRVILCVDPGWEQVAGALGIMAAGAACVPVAPRLAQTARWDTVSRVKATAVVTQWWQIGRIAWPEDIPVLTVEQEPAAGDPPPGSAAGPDAAAVLLPADGAGDRLALSHRSVLNSAADVNRRLHLTDGDAVLAMAPADGVLSLYQTLGPALAGARLVFGQDIDRDNPRAWLDQMERESVTVWLTTPALLTLALDHLQAAGASLPGSLRAVVAAGERLDSGPVRELRAAAGGPLAVAYATAPAAQHLWAAWQDVDEADDGKRSVPVGAPMANQRLYVLSEALTPCPVWVTGRLFFGGAAVAAGPGRAAHPLTGEPLLATELFGRLLPDGTVELAGVESSQVTVHGRPLRLQDVEIALGAHEAVRQAAVVPVGDSGESTAYVRPRAGSAVTAEELADGLRRKVSPYLMPAAIEIVAELPLTPDGLVDLPALRARASAPATPATPAAPAPSPAPVLTAGDEELIRRVTVLACRLFDVSDIEPNVNLMDIGASSYQLVRLATVLEEELSLTVDVEELLRFPSIAVIVSSHRGAGAPAAEPGLAPASSAPAESNPAELASAEPAPAGPAGPVAGLLTDLAARQAFKDRHLGIRHDLDDQPGVALAAPPDDDLILARRSARMFDPGPAGLPALSVLLAATRMATLDGEPKYGYPSAGGAYPVQVYVLVAPARVAGLPGGSYYYHPERNCLIPIDPAGTLPASAHADINRQAFRESAFSLYLIGRMEAITPLYGGLSADFAVFEAGAMTQLLAQTAAGCGLGLCPVGTMDTAPLPALFGLGEGDRFLHALLVGVPAARSVR
jgi:nonribosomal peptide synthetase protein BlmIII